MSVPVLSVQITVVEPSASTAGRLRTRACLRAMRQTPTASRIVTTIASPSGTAETAIERANMPIARRSMPRSRPMATKAAARAATASPIVRLSRRRRPISGGSAGSSEMWPAMRPTSLAMPVPTTTARPRPRVITVFMKTMSLRSPSGAPASSTGAVALSTATDSPVRLDSSAARSMASSSRASAATRSPAARASTSPGTTVSAGSEAGRPSRRIVAWGLVMSRRAASALAALRSW